MTNNYNYEIAGVATNGINIGLNPILLLQIQY